jgi:allophanate hydrolase
MRWQVARPCGLVSSDLIMQAASIALEIWSLPKVAMGCFLEGIPAPLGIGSIELSDGNWVKGFLCETSGLHGATDISHFADWRKFLSETV